MDRALFLITSAICAFFVFWKIADWPVYFFCDEAVFAQQALRWLKEGQILKAPLYYEIATGRYTPMLSSYLLLPFTYTFGYSSEIARSANAFWSIFTVFWIAKSAKEFIAPKAWFMTPILLLATPTWFLHARTAFDTPTSLMLLSASLYFYLKYRLHNPKYVFAFIASAAGYFYVYASSQMIAPILCSALLITDLRYHLKNWKINIYGIFWGLLLAIPAIIFFSGPVSGFSGQMNSLGSFILQSIPLSQKFSIFFNNYIQAFDPALIFNPDADQLRRHSIKDYGYLPLTILPFFITGFLYSIFHIKSVQHRLLLICLLTLPIPAALVSQSATRTLCLVVPYISIALTGINFISEKIKKFPVICLIFFSAQAISMSFNSIYKGPMWFSDYSLYGLQWGTRDLFEKEIPLLLKKFPDSNIVITPNFANNPQALVDFYSNGELKNRISLNLPDLKIKNKIDERDIFIVLGDEYKNYMSSEQFDDSGFIDTISYPDGTVGFYVTRLKYKENIDQILEQQKQARSTLQQSSISINGVPASIRYSLQDVGAISNIFDKDFNSLIRGVEANPYIIEINFNQPLIIDSSKSKKLGFNFGDLSAEIFLQALSDSTPIFTINQRLPKTDSDKLNYLDVYKPDGSIKDNFSLNKIIIRIKNPDNQGSDHIHIYELDISQLIG